MLPDVGPTPCRAILVTSAFCDVIVQQQLYMFQSFIGWATDGDLRKIYCDMINIWWPVITVLKCLIVMLKRCDNCHIPLSLRWDIMKVAVVLVPNIPGHQQPPCCFFSDYWVTLAYYATSHFNDVTTWVLFCITIPLWGESTDHRCQGQ